MQEQRPGFGGDVPLSFNPQKARGLFLLRQAGDAEELGFLMLQYRLSGVGVEEALRNAVEGNSTPVENLLVNPNGENRYRLGLVAGLLPSLDPSIQRSFKPAVQDGVNFKVTSYHKDWMLCQDAEDYMKKALRMDALVLVNGGILMKTVGKFTGLCVNSFSTSSATFLEGNWYSPVDGDSRDAIKQGFDRGDARIDLTEGDWILLRSIYDDKDSQEVLAKAKQKAADLPRHLPGMIRGVPRRKFRIANHEDMK